MSVVNFALPNATAGLHRKRDPDKMSDQERAAYEKKRKTERRYYEQRKNQRIKRGLEQSRARLSKRSCDLKGEMGPSTSLEPHAGPSSRVVASDTEAGPLTDHHSRPMSRAVPSEPEAGSSALADSSTIHPEACCVVNFALPNATGRLYRKRDPGKMSDKERAVYEQGNKASRERQRRSRHYGKQKKNQRIEQDLEQPWARLPKMSRVRETEVGPSTSSEPHVGPSSHIVVSGTESSRLTILDHHPRPMSRAVPSEPAVDPLGLADELPNAELSQAGLDRNMHSVDTQGDETESDITPFPPSPPLASVVCAQKAHGAVREDIFPLPGVVIDPTCPYAVWADQVIATLLYF